MERMIMSTAPQPAPESPLREELQPLREHWLMMLILGVAMALTGTAAIICAFIATLATVTFFGTLLFIGAVVQLVNGLTCRNWRGFVANLLIGILYGVVGVMMMSHPLQAAAGLTLLIAAAFIVGGIFRIVLAAIEHFHGWPWVMLNGFITLLL